MYRQNFQEYVKKLYAFLSEAKVITVNEAKAFLRALSIKSDYTDTIVKRLVSDTSVCKKDNYLMLNCNRSLMEYTDFNCLKGKINALYINLLNQFNCISYEVKYPCKAVLYNSRTGTALYVFYISENFVNDCNLIESLYTTNMTKLSPLNVALIINDKVDKKSIELSNNFNVIITFQNNKFTDERKWKSNKVWTNM